MADDLRDLLDRTAVVDTLVKLFVTTDQRDWEAVEECFAENVHFDVTSLTGGEPARLQPSQITAAWAQGLRPMDAIHHQAGNFRVTVTGDRAVAFCYAIATHYRRVPSGRNTRTFVGAYDFHLTRDESARWRIDLFRFDVKYVEGNLQLDSEPSAS